MRTITNNLGTYRILFLVKGILTLSVALLFLLYVGLGFAFTASFEINNHNEPFNPGILFIVIGGIGLIISVTFGVLTLMASKYLKEVKNYNFIFTVAIINCLTGVLGILLGVFTLIELSKPEVKALFYPSESLPDTIE